MFREGLENYLGQWIYVDGVVSDVKIKNGYTNICIMGVRHEGNAITDHLWLGRANEAFRDFSQGEVIEVKGFVAPYNEPSGGLGYGLTVVDWTTLRVGGLDKGRLELDGESTLEVDTPKQEVQVTVTSMPIEPEADKVAQAIVKEGGKMEYPTITRVKHQKQHKILTFEQECEIILRYNEGAKYKELAAAFGVSTGMISNILQKVRKQQQGG